ncbi:MAG TPA: hypothetical protein VF657_06355 [Actinoplanes sp.]|jgi:hypothetical protein
MRRAVVIGTATVAAILMGGTSAGAIAVRRYAETHQRSCLAAYVGEAHEIHESRWDVPADVDDLGDYLAVHWQAHTPARPCLQRPGRDENSYQLVVELRPDDARRLAAAIEAVPGNPAPRHRNGTLATRNAPFVWPALRSFVPVDARWVHNQRYDEQRLPERFPQRRLHVDPDHAIAVLGWQID